MMHRSLALTLTPATRGGRRELNITARPKLANRNIVAAGKLLWVAPVWALGYSRYMATAKKPPDKLAASLQYQQKSIDSMRASARLMKKIPKSMECPRSLVEVTNPGPSQTLVGAATGTRIDPSAPEEPPPTWTYSTE